MKPEYKWMTILREKCESLIAGCQITAEDGTVLYSPDGSRYYNAQWVRDFAYMVEYAGEYISVSNLEKSIRWFLVHLREDGWVPDRVDATGHPVYSAGPETTPAGLANLDNGPFLILLVNELLKRHDHGRARELFTEWRSALGRCLRVLPYSGGGLIYNDPLAIHSPYGFTDLVGKTGELFKESLLCWRAFRALENMDNHFGDGSETGEYAVRAKNIEDSIGKLYDETQGMFLAATEDCRQIDIWGNAYMLYIGFPCGSKKAETIVQWFIKNQDRYLYNGFVRHLPKGEYWNRVLLEGSMEKETYQNGAYWLTASGWLIWCLAQQDPRAAAKAFTQCLSWSIDNGFYECINLDYKKLNNYVVSGTNLFGALKRLLQENNTAFISETEGLFTS
jgi:hypothetical protein